MGAERLREIGQELRRLRLAAGLSGVGLASRAGVPQPTVSRVETGRRVSNPNVVARLFGALELDPEESERLAELVRAAYEETAAPRVDAGVSFRPGAGVEWTQGARVVRAFGAVVLPRLLWTSGFATAAESGGEGEGLASLLRDEGRRVVVVVGGAALRTWPGSGPAVLCPGSVRRTQPPGSPSPSTTARSNGRMHRPTIGGASPKRSRTRLRPC
ncbi:helix-turn-helix domain-containing protein [Actinomadura montaniterrae]|uniref:Helix-turn-helix domain-containing protein n=1 Tax=Actinomadura montaniterrae TaxID=1803903 RepID=A0A6L3W486_9ACTN|nr:helix-turn-helix domain-containing protein [Actinomadura montaniterrae]